MGKCLFVREKPAHDNNEACEFIITGGWNDDKRIGLHLFHHYPYVNVQGEWQGKKWSTGRSLNIRKRPDLPLPRLQYILSH